MSEAAAAPESSGSAPLPEDSGGGEESAPHRGAEGGDTAVASGGARCAPPEAPPAERFGVEESRSDSSTPNRSRDDEPQ